jgi:hypothetical protein
MVFLINFLFLNLKKKLSCCCSKSGDQPQEDLVKSSYKNK